MKKRKLNIFRLVFVLSVITLFIGGLRQFTKNFFDDFKAPYSDDKLQEILSNTANYPPELIELAESKKETIDFVYNYPSRTSNKTESSNTLTASELSADFPHFLQWDERWGYETYGDNYIAINGCGPTTLSMAIVGLTKNPEATPLAIAQFSLDNDHYVANTGTSWSLIKEASKAFGVECTEIPLAENKIRSALSQGEPIIASMRPGDFTSSGHFILLTGIEEDGQIIINDSDSKARSAMTWDLAQLIPQIKGLWKLS